MGIQRKLDRQVKKLQKVDKKVKELLHEVGAKKRETAIKKSKR